jgi:hypothetical protein
LVCCPRVILKHQLPFSMLTYRMRTRVKYGTFVLRTYQITCDINFFSDDWLHFQRWSVRHAVSQMVDSC